MEEGFRLQDSGFCVRKKHGEEGFRIVDSGFCLRNTSGRTIQDSGFRI